MRPGTGRNHSRTDESATGVRGPALTPLPGSVLMRPGTSAAVRFFPDGETLGFRSRGEVHMSRIVLTASLTAGLCASSAALAQTCPANVPHLTGTWATLPYGMPINPISATLLRTGKVLIIAGSENDASNNAPGAESYRAAVWDPAAASVSVQNLSYDVFCSGTSLLPDGRALVVGGTSDYSFTGDARASIFDPGPELFLQSQTMADGRWYGTAT